VNWDIERQVWDHLFSKERLAVKYFLYFNFYYALRMQHICMNVYALCCVWRHICSSVCPSVRLVYCVTLHRTSLSSQQCVVVSERFFETNISVGAPSLGAHMAVLWKEAVLRKYVDV